MGEYEELMKAVDLTINNTSFDNDFAVSVFEITIRTLG